MKVFLLECAIPEIRAKIFEEMQSVKEIIHSDDLEFVCTEKFPFLKDLYGININHIGKCDALWLCDGWYIGKFGKRMKEVAEWMGIPIFRKGKHI